MRRASVDQRDRVAIDANAMDADGAARGRLVERFRGLADEGVIDVFVPAGVRDELLRPGAPRSAQALFPPAPPPSPTGPLSHAQKLDRIRVRAILRGDAPAGRHDADASHLSEAAEAGCTVFVTHDRRILRRRDDLRAVMPRLRIMTLETLLDAVARGSEEEDEEAVDW